MKLAKIHLYLQRPATRPELQEYAYFKNLFEMMGFEERKRNQISTPHDLMCPTIKARNVVYFGTRDVPMFNEIFSAPVDVETGKPGANEAYKRAFARLMKAHVNRRHETFYVVGEFYIAARKTESKSRVFAEFRTLTARTEVPFRHIRH